MLLLQITPSRAPKDDLMFTARSVMGTPRVSLLLAKELPLDDSQAIGTFIGIWAAGFQEVQSPLSNALIVPPLAQVGLSGWRCHAR
jgi:hypothetical protein